MKKILAAAFVFAAVPAAGQTVETGNGDWSNVPEMRARSTDPIDADTVGAIAEMVDRGECTIPGQRRGRLDMTVPFLVLFKADGAIDRLVIRSIGCARAEGVLAGALLRMVQRGSFVPVGGRREGWFRGEVAFAQFAGS